MHSPPPSRATLAAGRRALLLRGLPGLALLALALHQVEGEAHAASPGGPGQGPQQPPQVAVVEVRPQPVPLTIDLPGRTAAYETAEVRPQVSGVIRERLFREGEEVKAGQQLYQIDPASYEATLASARAALAKAEASVASYQATVNRYRPLVRANAVSQQDLDNAVSSLRQAQADVESSRASIRTAEINLQYTRVYAPISGRISRSSVTPGALVTAEQTTSLASITRLDPIYVDMVQPSSALLALKRDFAAGRIRKNGDGEAEVTLMLEDGSTYPHAGRLQFSEVIVSTSTNSVTLRALFPNPDGLLLPGLFVHGLIQAGLNENAILVPQQGITRNMRAEAVALVVGADGAVEQRNVTTGASVGDQWLVTQGLRAGDRVIVEGMQRARPGAKVQVEVLTAEQLRQRNIRQAAAQQGR